MHLESNQPATHYTMYFSTQDTWDAIYSACLQAQNFISAEQYIFENDNCGARFMELFIQKAAIGVKVFLLCDRYGSASLYHSKYPERLREAGGYIHFYNTPPWSFLIRPSRLFPRTHAKLFAVDGKVGFIGSACIAERMRGWRDTNMKVEGDAARLMAKLLADTEKYIKRQKFFRLMNRLDSVYKNEQVQFLVNTPTTFRHTIYERFLEQIYSAQTSIHISSAFFVPNRRFMHALRQKARQGVQVMVLVPKQSDVWPADWVFLTFAYKLLEAGIRVFAYQPTVMHAKTIVIDNTWSTLGSTNMDILSFFFNREVNLVTRDAFVAKSISKQFEIDLQSSEEFYLEELEKRPWYIKILGYGGRLLQFILIKLQRTA